jgi:flagellar motor switch protein FliN/FliY
MAATDVKRFENLSFPLDIEIGQCEISVREILELKPGTILQTNRLANAPLTVRAGGTPIATGEVILVEDSLSVRIKDIFCSAEKTDKI